MNRVSNKKFKTLLIALVVAAALFYLSPVNIVGLFADISDIETSQGNIYGTGEVNVTITCPNGCQTWSVGSPHDIAWASDPSPPEWPSEVDIWLSKDSGSTWTSLIADSVANSGRYSWTPTAADVSNNCRIKVIARGEGSWVGRDTSDHDFVIK